MRKPLTGHTNGICKKEAKESKRATLQTLHNSLGGFRRLVGRNKYFIYYIQHFLLKCEQYIETMTSRGGRGGVASTSASSSSTSGDGSNSLALLYLSLFGCGVAIGVSASRILLLRQRQLSARRTSKRRGEKPRRAMRMKRRRRSAVGGELPLKLYPRLPRKPYTRRTISFANISRETCSFSGNSVKST